MIHIGPTMDDYYSSIPPPVPNSAPPAPPSTSLAFPQVPPITAQDGPLSLPPRFPHPPSPPPQQTLAFPPVPSSNIDASNIPPPPNPTVPVSNEEEDEQSEDDEIIQLPTYRIPTPANVQVCGSRFISLNYDGEIITIGDVMSTVSQSIFLNHIVQLSL